MVTRLAGRRADIAQIGVPEESEVPAPMLTDSGLETWLIFQRQIALTDFAAFPLLESGQGRKVLTDYFRDHLRVAAQASTGFVLETPTWRANRDWGARVGYGADELDRVNRNAVAFLRLLGSEFGSVHQIVSGTIGPRGDGYDPGALLTPQDAARYHRAQIDSFVAAGADRMTMYTATHVGEATGVVQAARAAGADVVVVFTVETDGRLPTGQPLDEAIEQVDAATSSGALHFGINCAHPDHFSSLLDSDPRAYARVGLVRANASRASHAELDDAKELDTGNPIELASQYAALTKRHPNLQVLGGCCGTDVRHVEAIAAACC
jgi:homocysteine S-methyltransferase